MFVGLEADLKHSTSGGWSDEGVVLGVDEADDAAEDHVDGGGQEGRPDEDQERVHDVRFAGVVRGLLGGDDAADVADAVAEAA